MTKESTTDSLLNNENITEQASSSNEKVRHDIRESFAKFEFDAESSIWGLDSETNVYTLFIHDFPIKHQSNIRKTLVHFAEHRSAKHTNAIAFVLKRYLEGHSELCLQGLLNFKANCPERSVNEYCARFRVFFKKMEYLGFKLPEKFIKEINSWVIKGNDKGIPVLTQDPVSGPFSTLEFRAIKSGLDYKYAEGVLSDREYSIVQIFAATMRRPTNLKQLKVKDFAASSKALITKQPIYLLNIPRAKGTGRRFRSQFKTYAVIESIGLVLTQHIAKSIKQLSIDIGRKLTLDESKELPIFFDSSVAENLKLLAPNEALDFLKSEIPHMSGRNLTKELVQAVSKLHIISERTGELLYVDGYRFRYTGGTRAAESGAGLLTISELLDHVDTQNAEIYIANSPEIGLKISEIMNNPMAHYANTFQGKIVSNENEANEENPGATRIPCREKGCDVGSCGSSAFCTDYAPVACYLCTKFRPWRDAPHHLVLEWLLEERERLSNKHCDFKVVSINDSAILAATQVIKQCEEEKQNV